MHLIKICWGGTCQAHYAKEVLEKAESILGIKEGESTPDGKFRLEKVGCIDQCELAPNVLFCRGNSPLSGFLNQGKIVNHCHPTRLEQEINNIQHDS